MEIRQKEKRARIVPRLEIKSGKFKKVIEKTKKIRKKQKK